jgi:ubiquinone/menaquinone biosynthesis C-methylase UbiE|tara:strand:+ start:142 stop:711 length:570 start_codon:yes stop_codon:yes gene_type:complete
MVGRGIYTNIIDRSYDKFLPEESEWVKKNEYVAPEQIVELFKQHNSNYQDDKILDAGCGTGAVAKLLNAKNLYGIDNHYGSLKLSQFSGLYEELFQDDLNNKLYFKDNEFDHIICCGTFTHDHVKPHALKEFVRIAKKTICISINFDYYHEEKFEETIKNLPIEEMDFFRGDYIRKLKRDAYYGIYKVL